MTSDDDLLRAFLDGADRAAFEMLVRRHAAFVQRVCRGVLRDAALAEDCTQETFVALLQARGHYTDQGCLRAWLGRVAHRKALDLQRGRRRRFRYEGEALAPRPASATGREDDAAEVRQCVDELPVQLRVPIQLKYFEGLKQSDIAVVLATSTGTVSHRLEQARELLRQRLAAGGGVLTAVALAGRLGAVTVELELAAEVLERILTRAKAASAQAGRAAAGNAASGGVPQRPSRAGIPGRWLAPFALLTAGLVVVAGIWVGIAPGDSSAVELAGAAPVAGVAVDLAVFAAPAAVASPSGSRPPSPPVRVTARPAGAAQLSGIVSDERAQPIAGARVDVIEFASDSANRLCGAACSAITDAHGRWRIDAVECGAPLRVRACHAEYAIDPAAPRPVVTLADGETRTIDLALHLGWTLELRVQLGIAKTAPRDAELRLASAAGVEVVRRGRADGSGRVDFTGIHPVTFPPELVRATLELVGALPVVLDLGEAKRRRGARGEQVLTLAVAPEPGAGLEGEVSGADGAPAEGCWVVAAAAASEGARVPPRATRSDARGRYRFAGLAPGSYVITAAHAHAGLDAGIDIELAPFEVHTLDLALVAARTLRGTLRGPGGEALAGVRVTLVARVDGTTWRRIATTTDDGGLELAGIPCSVDSCELHIHALGQVPGRDEQGLIANLAIAPPQVTILSRGPDLLELDIQATAPPLPPEAAARAVPAKVQVAFAEE